MKTPVFHWAVDVPRVWQTSAFLAISLLSTIAGCSTESTDSADVRAPEPEPEPASVQASPWASQTAYAAEVLDVELTAEDRELLDATNWRTGERFTERELKRLKYLRAALPGNMTLIALSAQERVEQQQALEDNHDLGERVDKSSASTGEITEYFEFKIQQYDDRLEVLQYVLTEPGWDATTRDRYKRFAEVAQLERDKLANQQEIVLSRAQEKAGR